MNSLIGLVGRRGCGKDTVAEFLKEAGYARAAFADALYIEVALAFGVSVAFLQNRDTKETPLPQLCLACCQDYAFVTRMLSVLSENGTVAAEVVLAEPRSPRQILQWWGTEYRRESNSLTYWLDQVAALINERADGQEKFVITDVRFRDEAQFVEQMGGTLVRIVRSSQDAEQDATLMHASERDMMEYPIDTVIYNNGTLAELRQAALNLVSPVLA